MLIFSTKHEQFHVDVAVWHRRLSPSSVTRMSATTPTTSAVRRNSSSVPAAPPRSSERVRRLSAAAPPPAPQSTGSTRVSAMAHAAAMATAEAERRARAGSPQTVKSAPRMQARAAGAKASPTPQPKTRAKQSPQQRAADVRQPQTQHQQTQSVEHAAVRLVISVLGLKFTCRVQREWPCEAMIATAVAEYHLAFPACEIPDFNTMYHTAREEFLKAAEMIGSCCADDDEIELGITEKPGAAAGAAPAPSIVSSASSDGREMFDFVIVFHRLPLGFTLKQNNEHIVVANIYPHSTATHYERLETGVRVVKIADTPLEDLGLRQVHDLIKNAKIPLEISFRGYKEPSLRSTLLMAAANPVTTAAMTTPPTETRSSATRRRAQSSPKPEDDSVSPPRSNRERSRATSTESGSRMVEMLVSGPPGSRNGLSSSSKRSGRSRRSSQESRDDGREADANDNQRNNQGGSSPALPNGQRAHRPSRAGDADEEPVDVRASDRDSNQNEDETEELLVDQIKTLQVALLKKHEEAKQIARQIELFHEKLTAVRGRAKSRGGASDAGPSVSIPAPPHSAPASTIAATSASSAASLKLRLTPEVLEAMDSKAGVPPKSASYYQSSNVSSVSGYSNYSNRSNAPRSARQSSLRRQHTAENMRSDASVASHSSDRRTSSSTPRSPRAQCVKNLNSRYNYIPQKYAATVSEMAVPTSLSSRGAVMSRAKATRDSFLPKSESPGVGYYDVKVPSSHVRGGEIGDSDRSLPWP